MKLTIQLGAILDKDLVDKMTLAFYAEEKFEVMGIDYFVTGFEVEREIIRFNPEYKSICPTILNGALNTFTLKRLLKP